MISKLIVGAATAATLIVVGQPLPETVVVTPIPDDPTYAYAVVNDERVIVEPSSRKVIQVIK